MKYVVIDLEMNPIATVHTAEREYCKLEVIEIGAVLLDRKIPGNWKFCNSCETSF